MACALVRTRQLTHTVVDHKPAVPGQDGRSTRANFQPSPRGNRGRQAVMRIEQAQVLNLDALRRHWAVGNPDAFMVEIHIARAVAARGFFRSGAWKERAMKQSHFHFSRMICNRDGEETGILVAHMDEVDSPIGSKGRQSQSRPAEQVV
jgi:hypothetical protein